MCSVTFQTALALLDLAGAQSQMTPSLTGRRGGGPSYKYQVMVNHYANNNRYTLSNLKRNNLFKLLGIAGTVSSVFRDFDRSSFHFSDGVSFLLQVSPDSGNDVSTRESAPTASGEP